MVGMSQPFHRQQSAADQAKPGHFGFVFHLPQIGAAFRV